MASSKFKMFTTALTVSIVPTMSHFEMPCAVGRAESQCPSHQDLPADGHSNSPVRAGWTILATSTASS
jgi:hypothetical protein